ncbi:hypothetical protein ABKN59_010400 [Abortiporus biennis]
MSKIVSFADASHLSNSSLPTAPDGRYDSQIRPLTQPHADDNVSVLHDIVNWMQRREQYGLVVTPELIVSFNSPDGLNDRSKFFNEFLHSVGLIDPKFKDLSQAANDLLIKVLYNTVPHPPATYVGTTLQLTTIQPTKGSVLPVPPTRLPFAARSADGSGNNWLDIGLGQAGQPYARSVQNKHPQPANTLPDAKLVFNALLQARDFEAHPGGNSSMTFAFASLVTHQLFKTDPLDFTKNNTSYLDLSCLYGTNQKEQHSIRNKDEGKGLLWFDAFAEDRLVFIPPAATALLVLFNRNHNYCANMILKINERGLWSNPPPSDPVARAIQDEQIFQLARNVNCGHFMAMIFGDYVAGFLGLGREGNSWSMNPFDPIKDKLTGIETPRGQGNHVSVEFNLLYRWHATTAKEDITWTEGLFNKIFDGKPFGELTQADFGPALRKVGTMIDPNPRTREFGGIKRNPDGSFNDDDIATILLDATDKPAGSYRARGIPQVLEIVELMTIEQARSWGVCTMNEFREFLGLKKFDTFEKWNSDKEIAEAARQLYGHVDNLELYPGLQAEEIIPLGNGSGLCAGYTITRAILGDAIALVRGDRFYTTDYTPGNLTSWGFQDCARDPNNGAFGAALPKLLMRHFPRHYPIDSAYSLFPFFTPETTKKNLENLQSKGIIDNIKLYKFDRPKAQNKPKVVNTVQGVKYVLGNPQKYTSPYSEELRTLAGDAFFLAFDNQKDGSKERDLLLNALWPKGNESVNEFLQWYKEATFSLLDQHKYNVNDATSNPPWRIDIVQNVINLVSVHWATDYLLGIPLKTKENPRGVFTEQEVFDMLALFYSSVFLESAPEHTWALRSQAKRIGNVFNSLLEESVKVASPGAVLHPFVVLLNSISTYIWPAPADKHCYAFLKRLTENNSDVDVKTLMTQVIGLAIGTSVNFAQAASQVIGFYLDPVRSAEYTRIVELVKKDNKESDDLLRGYIREALRLNPTIAGLLRIAQTDDTITVGDDKPAVIVKKGDVVYTSIRDAELNSDELPDPTIIDPTCPATSYIDQRVKLGTDVDVTLEIILEVVRIVFSLKNVRAAPGLTGRLQGIPFIQNTNGLGIETKSFLNYMGNLTPWPVSLTILFDA